MHPLGISWFLAALAKGRSDPLVRAAFAESEAMAPTRRPAQLIRRMMSGSTFGMSRGAFPGALGRCPGTPLPGAILDDVLHALQCLHDRQSSVVGPSSVSPIYCPIAVVLGN
jgi:hypothetical protein